MTSVQSMEGRILLRIWEGEPGEGASLAEAEHVGHGIEPRFLAARPQRRFDGAAGKDGAFGRAMGELDDLALAGKEDAVLANHGAAAECREADVGTPACTGMAVAAPDRVSAELDAASLGSGATEEKGGARGRVDLMLVVHFEDLDVEIGVERARRLAHQSGKQVDAEAHIAGLHDARPCRR